MDVSAHSSIVALGYKIEYGRNLKMRNHRHLSPALRAVRANERARGRSLYLFLGVTEGVVILTSSLNNISKLTVEWFPCLNGKARGAM